MPFFAVEKWFTPFWNQHPTVIYIFMLMKDSIRYFTFLQPSFFHRSLTAIVESRDGNRDSGTTQTCNLDSYLSTNAKFRCVTTKIESPEQISFGLFKWPKLSHLQLMPSYTRLWHHSDVMKFLPYSNMIKMYWYIKIWLLHYTII